MRILFLSSVPAPFQRELAKALSKRAGVDYCAGFALPSSPRRGSHWRSDAKEENVFIAPEGLSVAARARWAEGLVRKIAPQLVLIGGYRGAHFAGGLAGAVRMRVPHGFWLEVPNLLATRERQWLTRQELRLRLAGARVVLAIGDRAEQLYGRYCDNVALVPYGQDLSHCAEFERGARAKGAPLKLLFSGQLVKRHNIKLIMEVVEALHASREGAFQLVVAGHGPEQVVVDEMLRTRPSLNGILSYDREYASWGDRLRPFFECDVLLYPSAHSGWGLVVPEAMAAGQVVISTREVEAARYLVRDGVNGWIVRSERRSVLDAVQRCIDEPETVERLGRRARLDALAGDVNVVADQMIRALDACL